MRVSTTRFFAISCLGLLLFLLFPFILRIPYAYEWFSSILSVFRRIEYKGIYIETLGALYGAFLGVTGAVWVQNLAREQKKTDEIKRNAQMIRADLSDVTKWLETVIPALNLPPNTTDILHVDRSVMQVFRELLCIHHIVLLPDCKEMVLSLELQLESRELKKLLTIYAKLSAVSRIISRDLNNDTALIQLFSLMHSIYIDANSIRCLLNSLSDLSNK